MVNSRLRLLVFPAGAGSNPTYTFCFGGPQWCSTIWSQKIDQLIWGSLKKMEKEWKNKWGKNTKRYPGWVQTSMTYKYIQFNPPDTQPNPSTSMSPCSEPFLAYTYTSRETCCLIPLSVSAWTPMHTDFFHCSRLSRDSYPVIQQMPKSWRGWICRTTGKTCNMWFPTLSLNGVAKCEFWC